MTLPIKTCTYPGCNLPVNIHHDENCCLGHAPRENKNCTEQEFNDFLKVNKLGNGDFNFEGFKFPSLNLESRVINSVFQSEVNFRNCEFYKTNDKDEEFSFILLNKTFQKKVDFTGSKFFCGIHFQECRFHTICIIDNIKSEGAIVIEGGQLNKLQCSNSEFYKSLKIKIPHGIGELWFGGHTVFDEDMTIENQLFNKQVTFDDVTFSKHFSIVDSNFKEPTAFTNCEFQTVTILVRSFNQSVSLAHSKFRGIVNIKSDFKARLDINNAIFDLNLIFDNSNITEANYSFTEFNKVSFNETIFNKECNFIGSIFHDAVTFNKSNFNGLVDFTSTQFLMSKEKTKTPIIFDKTIFNDQFRFEDVTLARNIKFSNLVLNDKSHFSITNLKFIDSCKLLFENINFKPFKTSFAGIKTKQIDFKQPIIIAFRNCDLKDVLFSANNMTLFSFYKSAFDRSVMISNEWNSKRERMLRFYYKRRNIIFEDEYTYYQLHLNDQERINQNKNYFLEDISGFDEIASLYRRFKVALDSTKDYEQAGWFYFNEYEMKRKNAKNKDERKFYLYSLYKLFAGYGEKPLWSFYWLIIFLFTFTILNLFSGIRVNLDKLVNYDLKFSFNEVLTLFTSQFWVDTFDAFLFTLYRIIPVGYLPIPKEQFLPMGADGYLLAFLNTGILILFITFIAVGLKRIFRRF